MQLFSACSRPLLVGPDLRLVVSGVPEENARVGSGELLPAEQAG